MANLMVGCELPDMYPEKRTPGDEIVFAARGVSVPGWAEDISFELRRGGVLGFAELMGAWRTEPWGCVPRLAHSPGTAGPNDLFQKPEKWRVG